MGLTIILIRLVDNLCIKFYIRISPKNFISHIAQSDQKVLLMHSYITHKS